MSIDGGKIMDMKCAMYPILQCITESVKTTIVDTLNQKWTLHLGLWTTLTVGQVGQAKGLLEGRTNKQIGHGRGARPCRIPNGSLLGVRDKKPKAWLSPLFGWFRNLLFAKFATTLKQSYVDRTMYET